MEPLISFVISARSNCYLLRRTLDSLEAQRKKNFETILVCEAGISLAPLKPFFSKHILVKEGLPWAWSMNQGLVGARGSYVQFLFPGDCLLSGQTTERIEELLLEKKEADIICCPLLERDEGQVLSTEAFLLDGDWLRKGKIHVESHSFIFRRSLLRFWGGFNQRYWHRPIFDMLCKMALQQPLRTAYAGRVFVESDCKSKVLKEICAHGSETCRILYRHFGWKAAIGWLIIQDYPKLLRWAKAGVKKVFGFRIGEES